MLKKLVPLMAVLAMIQPANAMSAKEAAGKASSAAKSAAKSVFHAAKAVANTAVVQPARSVAVFAVTSADTVKGAAESTADSAEAMVIDLAQQAFDAADKMVK